ncbi:LytTR family transcriptional regulator [Saccharopolyspora subtropica]|uniref:LCP family protein n=1 Tax=Saccharopolyspora thermophila TaxID=89367 RepID=A0A917K755_9PSEU|nr:LCP family protein [Saccharopolyspora subtropica]GGJ00149.1 LytTR family transcriptional regulator [Saccharopolyspora subtropica]
MNTDEYRNDWSARAPRPATRAAAPRPETPARAPRRSRRRVIVAVLLVVLLFPLVFGGWLWFHADAAIHRIDAFPDYPGRPAAGAGTNWLIVGSDSREGLDPETAEQLHVGDADGQRTDTILIAHLPDNSTAPTLVSIPRDSQVPIPGHGRDLINAAFAIGGPHLLARTVEQATGLRIDHYAEIGFGGFAQMVDAVGGVEMCLDQQMHDDKTGQTLPAGCQELDGAQALTFVRMRYSSATPRSDLDRVANQRRFIGALASEASSFGTLVNPFATYQLADAGASALTMLESDGLGDLLSLAWAMRGISSGEVVTTTVPVTDSSAHQWHKQRASELFDALSTDAPVPEDVILR